MAMWIVIGLAAALTLSIGTGLAVAAVLGAIGRSLSEPLDLDPWASVPLTRGEAPAARRAEHRLASRGTGGS
jgi:hypothetical protein